MKKNFGLLDLIFYIIFPLIVWNEMKDILGEYYAMLLSTVPGVVYSLYRFKQLKRLNLLGLVLLGNLIVSTLLTVLSNSAIQALWNEVYYNSCLAVLLLITCFNNKPFAKYVALDLAEMQGRSRTIMRNLFLESNVLKIFKFITLALALHFASLAAVMTKLIQNYGTEAFSKGIIIKQVLSLGFYGLAFVGFIYSAKVVNENIKKEYKV